LPTTVTVTNGSTTATVIAVDDYFKETPEDLVATITGLVDQDDPDAFENLAIGDVDGDNASATTTITDESVSDPDDTVTLSIVGPASVVEGDATSNYTVALTDPAGDPVAAQEDVVVTITYTGTATDGSDYTSQQEVTILQGATNATFSLQTLADTETDPDETIILTISTTSDGGFEALEVDENNDDVTTVIEEPPEPPVYSVALSGADTVVEGESAAYTVTVEDADGNPVLLTDGQSVTVTLGTAAAGLVLAATEGVDYVSVDGDTVTITGTVAGVSSATFTVETTDDYLADDGEQYIVEISDPTGTGLGGLAVGIATGKDTVTTTIEDQTGTDDPPGEEDTVYAVISVDDAAIEEGEQAIFTVSLQDKDGNAVTATSDIDVTLEWTGAAANAGDAAPLPTTVTVTNGSTTATVIAVDDYFKETPEDLVATITGLVDQDDPDAFENLAIGDVDGDNASATTTITDESVSDPDDTVTLSIVGPASVVEGDATSNYTVALTDPAGGPVAAQEDVVVTITYTGTATDGSDYTSQQEVTILQGATNAIFSLQTLADTETDPDETIILTISTTSDGGFEALEVDENNDDVTTVIEEPPEPPVYSVALSGADTVVEGESAAYTVTVEDADGNPVLLTDGQSVTVTLGTAAAGLVLAATEGVDYVSVDGDTVTITGTVAGVSSATFTVETTDDYLADDGEEYIVEISDPTGTGLGGLAVGIATDKDTVTTTIEDQTGTDDPPGEEDTVYAVISVDDAAIEEGEQAIFTVSLQDKDGNAVTATSDIDVTLTWTGAAANAGDAAPLPTTVTVTNGSTTATVIAVDDYFKETPEDLVATITGLVDQDDPDAFENLAIGDVDGDNASATTTITDESVSDPDDTVTLSIVGPASVVEGDATSNYTVALTDPAGGPVAAQEDVVVTITYTGTATDGSDYTSQQEVTILQGATNAIFSLQTLADTETDPDETIILTISTTSDGGFEALEVDEEQRRCHHGYSKTPPEPPVYSVALSGAETVVEGESATYTVTVEDADGNAVLLTAGQSVTVTLGTAAGLVLAATEGVDYVSVDGDTVTITGTDGWCKQCDLHG
jgi:3-dehydroquinate dehydratase